MLLLLPLIGLAQNEGSKKNTWKQEKDYLKYQKEKKYKGPEDWYGSYPADMDKEEYSSSSGYNSSPSSGSGYGGIQYSPQQIQRDRQERYQGFDRGGGKGDLEYDPEVQRPEPIELPDIDFDPPDIDAPDIDLDIDAPTIPPGLWKALLFILIAAAIIIIAFLIFRNRQPSNKKIVVDVENDWNPEVITKTELEVRLEEAMDKEDYRECVRIYFTFILKELIRKSWIRWKKEKTNHHYLIEMNGKANQHVFAECIRIYDLVWYGEYAIDKAEFIELQPTLEKYYQSLEPVNE